MNVQIYLKPSGAGKTTLLNLLNGRNQGNLLLEGSIKINGHPPTKGFAGFSAYVQQDDLFVGTITVREHLWVQVGCYRGRGSQNDTYL